MSRIDPLSVEDLPDDLQPLFAYSEQTMGFSANDVLTMAHWPALLKAMGSVVEVTFSPGRIGMELKRLVAMVCSASAGCSYCVAHNALGVRDEGVGDAKRDAVWEFETSPLFSPAERAALKVAQGGGLTPNGVTDEQFMTLREHFDEREVLEIVAVIALFGFLNRWNATLATPLEDKPYEFANSTLTAHGWDAGPHR